MERNIHELALQIAPSVESMLSQDPESVVALLVTLLGRSLSCVVAGSDKESSDSYLKTMESLLRKSVESHRKRIELPLPNESVN